MYVFAICVILQIFHVHMALSGPLTEKLKLFQTSAVEKDVCPPGVWTCSTGKRSEIGIATRKTTDAADVVLHEEMTAEKKARLEGSQDPQDCPPGMWACKKKRMLKQILKTALKQTSQDDRVANFNPSQVSNDVCPPGVWTCSTGKRSQITQQAQVTVETPMLNERFLENAAKHDSSLQHVQKGARITRPPGMWVCDEIKENWNEHASF